MSGEVEHEIYTRRRGRNLAVAGALVGMITLLFLVTIVRLQENAASPFAEFNNPAQSRDYQRPAPEENQ